MPERPPSFEEFQREQEELRREAERIRSLKGMVKHGTPE